MKEAIIITGVSLIASALIGSCIYDIATSSVQFDEVTITDKTHKPGHYEQVCHTQHFDVGDVSIPVQNCHNEWRAPQWSITYNGNHKLTVSEAMYNQLQFNDRKFLQFRQGGFFGMRYDETILLDRPKAEQP